MIPTSPPSRLSEKPDVAGLDKTDYKVFSQLERVSFVLGERIYEADDPITYVISPNQQYFHARHDGRRSHN